MHWQNTELKKVFFMTNTPLIQKIIALSNTYHLPQNWLMERPHLFSNAILNLPHEQANIIRNTICTIETIITLPAFQTAVFSNLPTVIPKNPGNLGVLFGYDFHLTPEGPKLIEINTNAGGAFFVALLEVAHGKNVLEIWEDRFMTMFLAEWRKKNPTQSLKTIAIVDDNPLAQYFYPEFLLFQTLFEKNDIRSVIVDPSAFYLKENKLWAENMSIDLVYNRLTDFDLSQTEHRALQQAYTQNYAVITPHPYAHALYAHKHNLTLLADTEFLIKCGVEEKTAHQLALVIPEAHRVDPKNADNLWDTRKEYFFKPVSGFGSKGVYRGYNITRRVFNEILAGDYIAQTLVPPSEMQVEGEKRKVDLRAYAYAGEVLGFVARLYQGQTTNMRTPGGGFALVEEI